MKAKRILDVDLDALITALESDGESQWYFDPRTGQSWPDPMTTGEGEVEEHWIGILPLDAREAWEARAAFTSDLDDAELRARLGDALDGRGAFQRFRRVLDGNPKVLQEWYAFNDRFLRARALDWLDGHGIAARVQATA